MTMRFSAAALVSADSAADSGVPAATLALRSSSSASRVDRQPTKVLPLEDVQASLAPIQSNLSDEEALQAALELNAALLNAQLANNLLQGDSSSSMTDSTLLVAIIAFAVGVLVAFVIGKLPRSGRKQAALPPVGQIQLVIDTARGGVAHVAPPPPAKTASLKIELSDSLKQ